MQLDIDHGTIGRAMRLVGQRCDEQPTASGSMVRCLALVNFVLMMAKKLKGVPTNIEETTSHGTLECEGVDAQRA